MHPAPSIDHPNSAPVLDVRTALRQATADLHTQVDTLMPLAQPSPSLADYCEHLQLLLQWTARLPRMPMLDARLEQQAAALRADIAACDALLGPDAQATQPLPEPGPDRTPHADAFGWGVAYVIEGSHLGGQMLYRQLAERLAPHPLDFLRGAGKRTGARWTAFLEELRGHVATQDDIELACNGAVSAFELLLACRRDAGIAA